MDYWIEQSGRKPMYTERLLAHVMDRHGHRIVEPASPGAVCLVSLCDITELPRLAAIRLRYADNVIISGGHLAKIGAIGMGLHSDAVWVGHVFEFAELDTVDDIMSHRSCYVPSSPDREVTASTRIDWRDCPAIQVDKSRYYIFGGTGCRRKCSFCLTSNTEIHRARPGIDSLTARLRPRLPGRATIKVISNEYHHSVGDDKVQDMLLDDLLDVHVNMRGKMIRCGVEFATDRTRRRYGKPIKAESITAAIRRAGVINAKLHLFHISGIDSIDDWMDYVDVIPPGDTMAPQVYLKWTNLEYQQKTPLWRYVRDIDPDRYMTADHTAAIFQAAAHRNKRVRVMPVKYPAHAVWRICLSNVRDMDQYTEVMRYRSCKDIDKVMHLFNMVRPWETDLSWLTIPRRDHAGDSL